MKKLRYSYRLLATAGALKVNFVKADDLTPEEQALADKGATMEMYKPNEHSRHFIACLSEVEDSKTGKMRKVDDPTAE